ncbi:MAG: hypothetical protein AAGB05_15010 [Pseudomonadota bacterium]
MLAALRGTCSGVCPSGEHSKPLFAQYAKLLETPNVTARELRAAAKQVFDLAIQQKKDGDSREGDQDSTTFLDYLDMLC